MNIENVIYVESAKRILADARLTINRMKLSMMAHPDHTDGSEFDGLTTDAQDMENEISEYLLEIEELEK